MLNFYHNENLIVLWLLPLVVAVLIMAFRRQNKRLNLYSRLRLTELLSHRPSAGRSFWKGLLMVLSVSLLILASARPRWGFEWRDLPKGGTDLMVVLDLSESMLATDISPSRLERAKREISDLLDMLEGDRLGIVAFAGIPFIQCPLTTDYRLARLFVSNLNTSLIPVQGTATGDALALAMDGLEKGSEADSQGQAILLITDGEDQTGTALSQAKKAAEKGIRIFVIGIGKEEGAPIPEPGGGFKKDRDGNVIISRLDEGSLERIALTTGGIYVRSTTGDLDLDQIYHQGIRKTLEDQTFGETRQKIWHERFQWFIGAALFFYLLEFLLSGLKRSPTPQTRGAHHEQ